MKADEDRWLRPAEAAHYLSVSLRTLARMKKRQEIKHSYLGVSKTAVRYRLKDLREYMERRSRGRES